MSRAPDPAGAARRLGAAVLLFAGVLGVSRLGDLGVLDVPARTEAGGRAGELALEVDVVGPDGGPARPLGAGALAPGERLRLRYGPTRLLNLWVVEVEPGGELRSLLPSDPTDTYGRKAAPEGEVVPELVALAPGSGERQLLVLFTAIPRRFEELQAAARREPPGSAERIARTLEISGRRFVRRFEVARAGTSTAGGRP